MSPIGLGVIGAGYWGPNLVRTAVATPAFRLQWLCDLNEDRARTVLGRYTTVQATSSYEDVLSDPDVTAVAVATPAASHFEIVSAALSAGKHVLVEKPLTSTAADAEKLTALAERSGLTLMCDHTYCYTPAVQRVRELIRGGEIGDLQFVDSIRINLGLIQPDVDVLWDLAPHDVSILDFVLPDGRHTGLGGRTDQRPHRRRPGLYRVPVHPAVHRLPSARARQLAEPNEDQNHGVRGLAAHDRVERHGPRRPADDPRPRR